MVCFGDLPHQVLSEAFRYLAYEEATLQCVVRVHEKRAN